ncbi:MAG: efflux RND transporter permease subunit [Nevskiaceae bacterium]|nr:MAG: efflux RND transporter permease subunit [Nevskiaceae bacterium]TBR71946.1 MAG: efflux RND transporter permease subunit [Nevskiaceae bacterium]
MVNFFIDRPKFAWVIAIVIMLAGLISMLQMPIAQYPAIAPPSVSIRAMYPGASAETVQNTVTQIIEQQLTGIDHLLYFSSESNSNGSVQITLYFDQGTNPDIAQVQVQNKLQLATPSLPVEVQRQGIVVAKATKNFLIVAGFLSEDGKMDRADIADYIASHVQDPIARTPGVGDIRIFGAQHAMRIWLDPGKLNAYGMTPNDVVTAIGAQNVQIASGELGGLPAIDGQQLNATIIGPELYQSVDQFRNILLRVEPDGSQVRLKDVARVEIGAENYNSYGEYNGKPASGIAISLSPGANALETADNVRATIKRIEPFFPAGLKVFYPYDTTPFVKVSIEEVVQTLFEAVGLVVLVMLLFLHNLRATFIPTIAVPVVLLGTFGILHALGYSVNTLTMFAMVLSIGLLVDDAIVVIENVERIMSEEGLSPKEATRKSMKEIVGAMVGIGVVLTAVLLPMAFFAGSTGVIYRQFSVTMVASVTLSLLMALIFTPSLCATLLKPANEEKEKRGFAGWFNRNFDRFNRAYERSVAHVTGKLVLYSIAFIGIVGLMVVMFARLPTGFLPQEDQGIMFVQVTAPPGATLSRTQAALEEVQHYFLTQEKANVAGVFTVAGFSFGGQGQNSGLAFVNMKPWADRPGAKNSTMAVAERANRNFSHFRDAQIITFAPPAVLELGNATGFDFELMNQSGMSHADLLKARNQLLGMARKSPVLANVRPNGLDDTPMYQLDIDWLKADALGVTPTAINDALQDAYGSTYVNQFIEGGRVKKVYVQGDAPFRMLPHQLGDWYVRNTTGGMVPFSAFAGGHWTYGSPKLERYNGQPSIEILGEPAPGYSSGQAMQEMEKLAAKLPRGAGYQWTGLSFEQARVGSQTLVLYLISVFVVFLALAALYESWSIPLAVILVVPLGVIGAIVFVTLRGLDNSVFFQVGLLTTVGLAVKNAILIVEFAVQNMRSGMDLIPATIAASRQRLRPILMTSIAFMFGVLPLAVATGAGSGGRIDIGTGVLGGMFSGTVLAIFLVPVFFVGIQHLVLRRKARHAPAGEH